MLKTWIPEEIPEKEELKKRIKEAGEKLYQQQMKLKEHKLPVLVLFEGWGASGKGTTIGRVIKYIDPRQASLLRNQYPGQQRSIFQDSCCAQKGWSVWQ